MKDSKIFSADNIIRVVLNYGVYLLLFLACIILTFTTKTFLTKDNLVNVMLQTCIIGTIAIGMTFVIATDGIDLSVGGLLAIASAAGIGLIKIYNMPWYVGMISMILVASLFGLINGLSVAYLKIPAFLVTFSTQSISRGLTLVLSGGKSWFDLPSQFGLLAAGSLFGVPFLIIIMISLFIIFHIILKKSVYGRKILAVGGNEESARVSGISVERIKMSAYILSGAICGAAAILQTSRLNAFWASMGSGMEFSAIAGVVIGGTSLSGGKASMAGTFAGVVLMGVINNALNLLKVPANWQDVARGVIIFIAVALDALRARYNKTK